MGLAIQLGTCRPAWRSGRNRWPRPPPCSVPGTDGGYLLAHPGGWKAIAIGEAAGIEHPRRRHGRQEIGCWRYCCRDGPPRQGRDPAPRPPVAVPGPDPGTGTSRPAPWVAMRSTQELIIALQPGLGGRAPRVDPIPGSARPATGLPPGIDHLLPALWLGYGRSGSGGQAAEAAATPTPSTAQDLRASIALRPWSRR